MDLNQWKNTTDELRAKNGAILNIRNIDDYLKSKGQDSSYQAKARLAAQNGITNYTGTSDQDEMLFNTLTGYDKYESVITSKNRLESKGEPTKKTDNTPKSTLPSKKDGELYGVDYNTEQRLKSNFEQSEDSYKWDSDAQKALKWYDRATSGNIVSSDVYSALKKDFVVPSAVREADAYLAEQLEKIQSGKTSYSGQLQDMMDKIMNREKFSYDVDSDPLFQQALASAMKSGQQAMQDTMGQASALTGGYGSTYATTAGNQAYNEFIQDAYDNLPQYYQMAMEAYQMEGDEMYRQFGMVSELDDKEYGRNITAYDTTYAHRNQMYNEAYQKFRDSKTDALALAGIELDVHAQEVNDAYNYYNVVSNYADKMYEREYGKWADDISKAMQFAQMLRDDFWNKAEYDRGVQEHDDAMALQYAQLAQQALQHQDEMSYRYYTSMLSQMGSMGSPTPSGGRVYFNNSSSSKKSSGSSGRSYSSSGGGGDPKLKEPTETQMYRSLEAYNNDGMDGYSKYLDSLPSNVDKELIHDYVAEYGELPYSERKYTIVDDGGINWFGGVDNNAVVVDEYNHKMTLGELKEYDPELAKELSDKKYTKGSSNK